MGRKVFFLCSNGERRRISRWLTTSSKSWSNIMIIVWILKLLFSASLDIRSDWGEKRGEALPSVSIRLSAARIRVCWKMRNWNENVQSPLKHGKHSWSLWRHLRCMKALILPWLTSIQSHVKCKALPGPVQLCLMETLERLIKTSLAPSKLNESSRYL